MTADENGHRITIVGTQTKRSADQPSAKERSYWGAVGGKDLGDKLPWSSAILLVLFVIGISVGAPWIGDNVLGFDPTGHQSADAEQAADLG